jgi:hypothetical protein
LVASRVIVVGAVSGPAVFFVGSSFASWTAGAGGTGNCLLRGAGSCVVCNLAERPYNDCQSVFKPWRKGHHSERSLTHEQLSSRLLRGLPCMQPRRCGGWRTRRCCCGSGRSGSTRRYRMLFGWWWAERRAPHNLSSDRGRRGGANRGSMGVRERGGQRGCERHHQHYHCCCCLQCPHDRRCAPPALLVCCRVCAVARPRRAGQ